MRDSNELGCFLSENHPPEPAQVGRLLFQRRNDSLQGSQQAFHQLIGRWHQWPARFAKEFFQIRRAQAHNLKVVGSNPTPATYLGPKTIALGPYSLHWEFMFARARYETDDMGEQGRLLNEVARLVDAGQIRTTMRQNLGSINAANLKRAHALIESGTAIGKFTLAGF